MAGFRPERTCQSPIENALRRALAGVCGGKIKGSPVTVSGPVQMRGAVASLWPATRAGGFSGNLRPTLRRGPFHPPALAGSDPRSAFLQTCPFLRSSSTPPYRHRELYAKRYFGYRHPYRGGRSNPSIVFCHPPFAGWCLCTHLRQGCKCSFVAYQDALRFDGSLP